MTREFSITEVPSITYKLRNLPEGGWADITLREWPEGGSFQCQSDYGDYAYIWTATGPGTFKEFLCGLDKDYFLKKTRSKDYRVFDTKATCKQIKEEIIQLRKEDTINSDDARECWDEITSIEEEDPRDTPGFWYLLERTETIDKLYHWDPASVPHATVYNCECVAFWERVWPRIVAYWREHP